MNEFISVESRHWSRKTFIVLLAVAYLFALAVRYIWIDWAGQFPEFFWNGQLMINTNDGYFWAEGARDILAGVHQPHDLSPVDQPISILTAWLARILPFSFETVILWMPAVFGSLLVVPVMLIGRALRLDHVGFLAALLAGNAWSYYNRTMAGYYDTDMLTIVLPTFVLWSLIFSVRERLKAGILLVTALMLLYQMWYPSAMPLNSAFGAMLLLYTLLFHRRDAYLYLLLLAVLITVLPYGAWWIKLAAVGMLYLFVRMRADAFNIKLIFTLLALGAVLFVVGGGLDPIWYQIKGYILREAVDEGTKSSLHFYAVSKTVREAGKIPFEVFADRISGHPIVFFLSLIGYVMMALRYRLMWLALPMVGLGFIAMQGGLRFTVYAVPVLALGMGYLIVWFSQRLIKIFVEQKGRRVPIEWAVILLLGAAVLGPNILHVLRYKVPTVFDRKEVSVLDRLHKIAGREDYVLAWWDYGYPIRYYSDVKTLIDGGKHTGEVNYPVSYALTKPQSASAAMARLDVEYTESAYRNDLNGSYLQMMMEDRKIKDPELFLTMLEEGEVKLPPKSREIYYYLPFRMMEIFPTVAIFSAIDLKTGTPVHESLFYTLKQFVKKGSKIIFGSDFWIDLENGTMRMGRHEAKLNRFVVTQLRLNGTMKLTQKSFDWNSRFYLVYMKNYRQFLLMDRRMFDSTYVQLFVLRRYDPKLFEPVILDPMAVVYRLKT